MGLEEIVKTLTHLDLQTCVFFLIAVWWGTRGIRTDLKEAVADIKAQGKKSDKLFADINARTDRLNARSDALQKALMDAIQNMNKRR